MNEMNRLIEKSVITPVTVSDLKKDLRLEADFCLDDELILSYIFAATKMASEVTGLSLIGETYKYSIDFPFDEIKLPLTPVISITEIQYFDADNVSQVVDSSNYYLYNFDQHSEVVTTNTYSWPDVYDRKDAFSITYRAGMGETASSVPDSIKRAIRLIVAHWYEHRTAVVNFTPNELPMGVESLLSLERRGWLA